MGDVVSLLINIYSSFSSAPFYHLFLEGLLLGWIVWLLLRKSYRPSDVTQLTEKEKEELIAEWQPEPLVPDTPQDHPALHPLYVEGKMKKHVQIDGKEYLNASTLNFLDLVGDERIEEAATKSLFKYGVGSCGPRGFYGTVDVHLDLEKRLAEFMRCEEAVLYSYGFPTIASAIPAYAKRGDVVFCDKGVNFAIQKGLEASRARVEFFKHNDVEDLERLLKIQQDKDKQNPKKAKVTRRFMIVEGIYINYGDICPLPKLMELKWKYSVRIFMDESVSLGVLGASGRGVTEYFNIDAEDIDMICASLENAIATTGGFCAGRSFVVDHQRLSGLGYCFSASLPPLLASAAIEAFNIIETEPRRLVSLRENSARMLSGLRDLRHFVVSGVEGSPVFHLRIAQPELRSHPPAVMLDKVVRLAKENDLILTRAAYLPEQELYTPEPSIRVAVSSGMTAAEIDKIVNVIEHVSEKLF